MTTLNLFKNKKDYFSTERCEIIEQVPNGGPGSTRNMTFIPKNGDICKIKNIVFELSHRRNNDLEMFDYDLKEVFENGFVELVIGSYSVSKIDFSIIISVSKVIKTKTKVILEIPEYFFGEINMCALELHDVMIITELNNADFSLNGIHCVYKYLSQEEKMLSKVQTITTNFQNIKKNLLGDYPDRNIKFSYYGKGNTKGFFINMSKYEIQKISISVRGYDKNLFNEEMILSFCKEIDDNLFYLPINVEKKYNDSSFDSYTGSLNCNYIDKITINIQIKEDCDTFNNLSIFGL